MDEIVVEKKMMEKKIVPVDAWDDDDDDNDDVEDDDVTMGCRIAVSASKKVPIVVSEDEAAEPAAEGTPWHQILQVEVERSGALSLAAEQRELECCTELLRHCGEEELLRSGILSRTFERTSATLRPRSASLSKWSPPSDGWTVWRTWPRRRVAAAWWTPLRSCSTPTST